MPNSPPLRKSSHWAQRPCPESPAKTPITAAARAIQSPIRGLSIIR